MTTVRLLIIDFMKTITTFGNTPEEEIRVLHSKQSQLLQTRQRQAALNLQFC